MAMRRSVVGALLVLLAAHAVIAAPLLWNRLTQPVGWPLAALVLVWTVLVIRASRGGFHFNGWGKACVSCSAAILLPSLILRSPWLAMTGIWLLAAAATCCLCDQRYRGSLAISHWALLLFAGFPGRVANPLGDRLRTEIRQHAVLENLRSGKLVWLEGEVLSNGSGFLDPDIACNSSWIWGGLLALAWSLLMLRRASSLQAFVAIAVSTFWGIPIAAVVISSSLSRANPDASGAILPNALTWCFAALAGATLVVFTDIFVSAIAAPIPGAGNAPQNAGSPFAKIWNKWVSGVLNVRRAPDSEKAATETSTDVGLRWPEWSEQWDALWEWWYSRSIPRLAIGLPLLAIATTVFLSRSSRVDREAQAMTRLENIQTQADRDGNSQVQERVLRAKISLKPQVGSLHIRLIELLWATGQREACWRQLQPLIADGEMSSPSARLWFVRNSLQADPLHSLTPAERVDQLRKVVDAEPTNSEALTLLAEAYLSLGEPALAERSFVKAADADSGWNRQLLSFYQASGRPMQERRRFELHLQHLLQKFRDTPGNSDALTELVQFQVLMGQHSEALQKIAELRATTDSDQLKQLEAEVRVARVGLISQAAFLRMQTMIDDVETAMLLAPESLDPLSLAVVMKVADGAEFDRQVVQQVLDHWLKREHKDDVASCGQGMALVLADKYDEGAASFRKAESLSPAMSLALIQALRRSGKTDDALTAARTAVARSGSLATPSLKRQAALFWAAAGAPASALTDIPVATGTALDPELEAFVALMQFDQVTNYPGDLADASDVWQPATTMVTTEILTLLKTALRQTATQTAAARRLYRLRKFARPGRPKIENWLLELRAELGDPEQVLLILGTMGLYEEAWEDSLYWLDATVRTTRVNSIAALNNLAIAIVRSRTRPRYPEAMTLVNSALRLNPQNPDLLASRGEVAMALEQWESARSDLENVLTVQPEHPDALRLLPAVYTALGDHAAATAIRSKQTQSVPQR